MISGNVTKGGIIKGETDFSSISGAVILCLVVCKNILSHRLHLHPSLTLSASFSKSQVGILFFFFFSFAKANTEREKISWEAFYHLMIYILIKMSFLTM